MILRQIMMEKLTKTIKNVSVCLGVLGLLTLAKTTSNAAVLYTQHFDYTLDGTTNTSLNGTSSPWLAYSTSTAKDTSGIASGTYAVVVAPHTTNTALSTTKGYVYTRSSNSSVASQYALMSEAITTSSSWAQSGLNAFVFANASHQGFDTRMLVEVGGQWYASSLNLNLAVGDLTKYRSQNSADIQQHSVNYLIEADAANWVDFDFTAGESMSLGTASSTDLEGAITRVGFYVVQPANPGAELSMARFDAFILSEVPEPSRALLICAGLWLVVFSRRRNR